MLQGTPAFQILLSAQPILPTLPCSAQLAWGKGGAEGETSYVTPLLTRTLARWPTRLYALRSGTFSRLISHSTTTSLQPGTSWRPLIIYQYINKRKTQSLRLISHSTTTSLQLGARQGPLVKHGWLRVAHEWAQGCGPLQRKRRRPWMQGAGEPRSACRRPSIQLAAQHPDRHGSAWVGNQRGPASHLTPGASWVLRTKRAGFQSGWSAAHLQSGGGCMHASLARLPAACLPA